MLGWEFYIYKDKSDTLMKGKLAFDGLWWIKPLVESGEVKQLTGNGYPNLYEIRRKDLTEFLGEHSNLDSSGLDGLDGDDVLTLEAWDRS